MTTASPSVEEQPASFEVPGTLQSYAPNILASLSGRAQSTLLAGGSTYLALAPKLTALTMYATGFDALPEKVREAADGVINAGWTGAAMAAVAGIGWLWAHFTKTEAYSMQRFWSFLGRAMTPFTVFLLLALVVLALGGCTTQGSVVRDVEEAADNDGGLAKKMADRLLGEVQGQDNRGVRMCMIAAVASELVAYRISQEPQDAMAGLGQILALDGAVNRFVAADEMWMNTEIAHITLQMTSIMVDSAKARIPKLLANFAGGVNVLGLLDRAAIAAGQGTLLAAGIEDIRDRIVALNAGTVDPAQSMLACRARLNGNKDRVAALIGMAPDPPVSLPGQITLGAP